MILSSLENAVTKDQAFKLVLVSLFGSPVLSFATMPVVSQEKAKPLLPPTLPAHSVQSCSVNLHIYTHTASEAMAIHPLHSRLTSMSLPLA